MALTEAAGLCLYCSSSIAKTQHITIHIIILEILYSNGDTHL